jgi:hypothetical protein
MANLSNIDNKFLVSTNGEVRIADTSVVANVKLRVKQTSQTWTAQFINTDSSVAYGISVDTSASSYGLAGTLQCYTNAGGGFIVRNDSRVGIGTASPAATLEVQESGITVTNTQAFVASFIGDGYGTGQVAVLDSATIAANVGGEIQFGGKYTGNTLTEWASIGGYKDNATDGQYGGYFTIKTRANGGSLTERMRITSAGNTTFAGAGDFGGHVTLGTPAGASQTGYALKLKKTNSGSSVQVGAEIMATAYPANTNGGNLIFKTGNTSAVATTALTIDGAQNATFAGDVGMADDKKLQFGAGNDLRIYHVANSNSYIEEHGAGALVFKSNDYYFQDTSSATALHLSSPAGNATFAGTITGTTATFTKDQDADTTIKLYNPNT